MATSLADEEAVLENEEARLSARLLEVRRREESSLRALEEQRQALNTLKATPAGAMAGEALGQLGAFEFPKSGALPERARANEARRAALEARRAALAAESADLARREEAVGRAQEAAADAQRSQQAIRRKLEELAEAALKEAALAEAQRAAAARPPPPPAQAVEPAAAAAPEPSRRRSERVRVKTDVNLHSESNLYTGFSADLSDGGIFVATYDLLAPGTDVDVSFSLPGERRVDAKGVVRWLRELNDRTPDIFPGVGIEFVEMSDEARKLVHEFTNRRDPLFWAS